MIGFPEVFIDSQACLRDDAGNLNNSYCTQTFALFFRRQKQRNIKISGHIYIQKNRFSNCESICANFLNQLLYEKNKKLYAAVTVSRLSFFSVHAPTSFRKYVAFGTGSGRDGYRYGLI
jgi:hypothetical protein